MPKSLGEPLQKSKVQNPNGQIALVHGNKMFLSDPVIKFKPEVGNFYLFPNYMMHTVYPFSNSKEERRSISFNARINDEIYNMVTKNDLKNKSNTSFDIMNYEFFTVSY